MKTSSVQKALLLFALAAAMLAGCQKERDFPEPAPTVSVQGIVEEAKDWFARARTGPANGELDLNLLELDWEAHQLDRNKAGQAVLTVPVANRFEPGREYMEIAYVADGRGGVGVVKHYLGDLAGGEKVGMKLYDALGRAFVQGRYDPGTGLFSPTTPLATKKGKLNKIASLSSQGNNTSEEGVSNPDNPIVIDEVEVTAPAPNNGCTDCGWSGGGGWTGGGNSGGGSSGGGGSGVPVPPGGGWNGGGSGGSGGGNPYSGYVALAPDVPINLQERLNCFNAVPSNSSTVYKITLNTHKAKGFSEKPGHAFITLEKSTGGQLQRLSYGFYPVNGPGSLGFQPVTSAMGEESGAPKRQSDARYTLPLSQSQFETVMTVSVSLAGASYDLDDNNCVHYATDVFNTVNPPTGQINNDGFVTPGSLYTYLNNLKQSGNSNIEIGRKDPLKSTNCNTQ